MNTEPLLFVMGALIGFVTGFAAGLLTFWIMVI